MSRSVAAENGSGQAQARDPQAAERDLAEIARSRERDLFLSDLRDAMKVTGWTEDALAIHWDVDRSYVNRLLNDEKPWSNDRVLGLPDDLEGALYAIRAERFGAVVVQPLSGVEAMKAFVGGLVGLMSAPQLPEKATAMVKAQLAPRKVAVNE